jgi:hypothetical protein
VLVVWACWLGDRAEKGSGDTASGATSGTFGYVVQYRTNFVHTQFQASNVPAFAPVIFLAEDYLFARVAKLGGSSLLLF